MSAAALQGGINLASSFPFLPTGRHLPGLLQSRLWDEINATFGNAMKALNLAPGANYSADVSSKMCGSEKSGRHGGALILGGIRNRGILSPPHPIFYAACLPVSLYGCLSGPLGSEVGRAKCPWMWLSDPRRGGADVPLSVSRWQADPANEANEKAPPGETGPPCSLGKFIRDLSSLLGYQILCCPD